jgi:hypothetical protein
MYFTMLLSKKMHGTIKILHLLALLASKINVQKTSFIKSFLKWPNITSFCTGTYKKFGN